jgi:hypothetical protein
MSGIFLSIEQWIGEADKRIGRAPASQLKSAARIRDSLGSFFEPSGNSQASRR